MKKSKLLSLAFAFAVAGLLGSALAADRAEDAYNAYSRKVAPIEQQLYAKEVELDELFGSSRPDTGRVQELYKEIGELKGQLFAAEAEFRAQQGGSGAPAGFGHHPGEFSQGGYGRMGHGGGHHGGW